LACRQLRCQPRSGRSARSRIADQDQHDIAIADVPRRALCGISKWRFSKQRKFCPHPGRHGKIFSPATTRTPLAVIDPARHRHIEGRAINPSLAASYHPHNPLPTSVRNSTKIAADLASIQIIYPQNPRCARALAQSGPRRQRRPLRMTQHRPSIRGSWRRASRDRDCRRRCGDPL
jgi:hypothetical protein